MEPSHGVPALWDCWMQRGLLNNVETIHMIDWNWCSPQLRMRYLHRSSQRTRMHLAAVWLRTSRQWASDGSGEWNHRACENKTRIACRLSISAILWSKKNHPCPRTLKSPFMLQGASSPWHLLGSQSELESNIREVEKTKKSCWLPRSSAEITHAVCCRQGWMTNPCQSATSSGMWWDTSHLGPHSQR